MFRYVFFIGLFHFLQNEGSSYIHKNILHTSILPFFPSIKLHDIVVISTPFIKNEVYTIDFSPLNQSPMGLLSMFLGKNVSAEIRVRHIENVSLSEPSLIIQKWCDMNNNITKAKSQELTDSVFYNITDEHVKIYIENARQQNRSMNMYTYNCKHFSNYIVNRPT